MQGGRPPRAGRRSTWSRRPGLGELVAGGSALLLVAFMFVGWGVDAAGEVLNAWEASAGADKALLALAVVSVASAAVALVQGGRLARRLAGLCTYAGTAAAGVILTFLLEADGFRAGIYLSLAAAAGVVLGGAIARQDARPARASGAPPGGDPPSAAGE